MTSRVNIMSRTAHIDLPVMPDLKYEKTLWNEGFHIVAGLDEAGRGAWAGPVYAAAVVLPNDESVTKSLSGVRDSKQMSAHERQRWEAQIKSAAVAWAVASASEGEIDEIGIMEATYLAMQRAIHLLSYPPEHLLVDYVVIRPSTCPQLSLTRGDCRSLSIAAASVLAKTARDAFMCAQDATFPGYGFARHKGYGTPQHLSALHTLGLSPFHRKTFRPMKVLIAH